MLHIRKKNTNFAAQTFAKSKVCVLNSLDNSMIKQILGGRILTPQGWLRGGSVIVDGQKIIQVQNTDLIVANAEVIDAHGCDIVPGAVELHIHGGGGRDYMEGTREAFEVAAQAHLQYGTTSIFPTLSSSTIPMIEKAIETCEDIMLTDPNTTIQGLHLEGPYFNLEQAGAQIPEWIQDPNPEDYMRILQSTHVLKRWDEAPELEGSIDFIRACCQYGVLPSIAHTRALYDNVRAANRAGMTHATHFYNAMPCVYKNREYKVVGTVESIFAEQNMTVEVIADGIHVPPVMMRMVWELKGTEKMCLITDSLACSAMDADLMLSSEGSDANAAFDPRVIIEDGVCKLRDRSALAGSIATMDRVVRTAVQQAEIPAEDAYRMISETPAKIMGIYDRKGSLQRGKDADILMFDRDMQLRFVMQLGNVVKSTL